MKKSDRLTVEAISTRLRAWFISYDGKLPMDDQAYTQLREIVEEHFENKKYIQVIKDQVKDGKLLDRAEVFQQQEPRVSRGWVDNFALGMPNLHQNKIDYTKHKFKEIGVEVVEKEDE